MFFDDVQASKEAEPPYKGEQIKKSIEENIYVLEIYIEKSKGKKAKKVYKKIIGFYDELLSIYEGRQDLCMTILDEKAQFLKDYRRFEKKPESTNPIPDNTYELNIGILGEMVDKEIQKPKKKSPVSHKKSKKPILDEFLPEPFKEKTKKKKDFWKLP